MVRIEFVSIEYSVSEADPSNQHRWAFKNLNTSKNKFIQNIKIFVCTLLSDEVMIIMLLSK